MSTCLVADIGGTNGRFAILSEETFSDYKSFPCAEFDSFKELLDCYISQLRVPVPKLAAFAVASHVSSNEIKFTNLPWSFNIGDIFKLYDFHYLKVLNDFTAISVAVPLLEKSQLIQIGGQHISGNKAKAVIGAGTGLGVSGILPHNNLWVPVQGEGGHVAYGPYDSYEQKLFEYIKQVHSYISAECLLSGRGLELLYKAVSFVDGVKPENYIASDIVGNAIQHAEPKCTQTLNVFSSILGSVASDLVLTLGAKGGVYIGGGVVNHMIDYFTNNNNFRSRFETKGCMSSYVKNIPAYIISDSKVGLLGAYESVKPGYESIGITHSR